MAELNITLDRKDIARFRRLMKLSPMMAAKSLTFTAEKARDDWRAGQAISFHLRRKWLQTGTQVRAATPSTLTASVGSLDRFFGRHVSGVNEEKRTGRGRLFVPVQPVEEQGTHLQIRRQLRRMAGTKTKPFVRKGMLFRRLTRKGSAPLKVLGVFRKSVHITPRFDAQGITERAVRTHFPTIYQRLLLKALDCGRS